MIEAIDRLLEGWLAAAPRPWNEPSLPVVWDFEAIGTERSAFVELVEIRPETTGLATPALRKPAAFILKYAVVVGGSPTTVSHRVLSQILTSAVRSPAVSDDLRVEVDPVALPADWWPARGMRPRPALVLRLPLLIAPVELQPARNAERVAVNGGPIRVARGRLLTTAGAPLRDARMRTDRGLLARLDPHGCFELDLAGPTESVLVTFEGQSRRRTLDGGGVPEVLVWEEMERTDGD